MSPLEKPRTRTRIHPVSSSRWRPIGHLVSEMVTSASAACTARIHTTFSTVDADLDQTGTEQDISSDGNSDEGSAC